MKVLIIDDEEDVRYIVRMSIGRGGGFVVLEAERGSEGIAIAKSDLPDVILLDLMMPGVDGVAVFRELSTTPETAAIPVIFLTAAAMDHEVQRLYKLGAKGVIRKPFDPLTLGMRITSILAS